MDWNSVLTPILTAVGTALAVILVVLVKVGVKALTDYLAIKTGNETLDLLKGLAQTIVLALEQSFKELDSTAKKERALAMLQAEADTRGIKVEFEQVDKVIEEAVALMNQTIKPAPMTLLVPPELTIDKG